MPLDELGPLAPSSATLLPLKSQPCRAGFFLEIYLECIVCIGQIQYKRAIHAMHCMLELNVLMYVPIYAISVMPMPSKVKFFFDFFW